MVIEDKVIQAIRQHWGIHSNFEEQLSVQELKGDWIVWRRQDAGKAGGLRLVVPKRGAQAFEISSSACADDQHGISWEYEIVVLQRKSLPQEAAMVLEKHTGMSRVESYKFLKSGHLSPRAYFIAAPLELISELRNHNVFVKLVRPGDRGEYC